jgi:[amino group carrier protein]-L-2-aminoadipate 6-kinase
MIRVLKLGGGAGVEHTAVLQNLAERIQAGEDWVLVHGASDAANTLAEQVGYPARTITTANGHTSRYTDSRTIEIFSAAAGSVNQQLSAQLASFGVNAVGLSGPTIIHARRKSAIRAIHNGRPVVIRDDYSGTITGINLRLLRQLLDIGVTPVVAPLAIGEEFERLNVDGDLVAAEIARGLQAETLVILSNVPGLLRDVNDRASLVTELSLSEIERYDAFANGRMKKKLLAAQRAEIARVILADSRLESPLDAAINGGGTHIWRTQEAAANVHFA